MAPRSDSTLIDGDALAAHARALQSELTSTLPALARRAGFAPPSLSLVLQHAERHPRAGRLLREARRALADLLPHPPRALRHAAARPSLPAGLRA